MKRLVAVLICFMFLVSFNGAFTFKDNSYDKNLKIGLKNMTSNNINVVLNGSYSLNNTVLDNGTSFTLSLSSNQIIYNGMGYDELVFTPESPDDTIRLEIGAKRYNYEGIMDFKASKNGILPINIIDLEEYLKGVVAFEMSNSFPLEALKAQAVAARNYALSNIGKHAGEGYDLCDTTDCQVYRGYNPAYTNVINAVETTRGLVLVYNNALVNAYYSASSGGYTEASGNVWKYQLPYLISKEDDFENENWPYGNMAFTTPKIDSLLKSKSYIKQSDKFEKIDLDSIVRDESGRVESIDILYISSNGNEIRKCITKEGARTWLSLPSSLYNAVYDPGTDTYTFSGKGYGHGVGMSQIGAKNRANAGQDYLTILTFYYDGTSITNMNSGIQNAATEVPQSTGSSIDIPQPQPSPSPSEAPVIVPKPTPSPSPSIAPATPPKTDGISNTLPPKTAGSGTNASPDNNGKTGAAASNENYSNNSISISIGSYPRELKYGMSGTDVKNLEEALKTLSYLKIADTVTFFGNATQSAIVNFQKAEGMKETGEADRETLDLIYFRILTKSSIANSTSKTQTKPEKPKTKTRIALITNKELKKGMKGTEVKNLQAALKNFGYFSDQVNGIYGTTTESAVKKFQKSNGLASVGRVEFMTIFMINKKIIEYNNA